jgi:hypothetical protein
VRDIFIDCEYKAIFPRKVRAKDCPLGIHQRSRGVVPFTVDLWATAVYARKGAQDNLLLHNQFARGKEDDRSI